MSYPPSSLGTKLLTPRLMLIRGESKWAIVNTISAQHCRANIALDLPVSLSNGRRASQRATVTARSCQRQARFGTVLLVPDLSTMSRTIAAENSALGGSHTGHMLCGVQQSAR